MCTYVHTHGRRARQYIKPASYTTTQSRIYSVDQKRLHGTLVTRHAGHAEHSRGRSIGEGVNSQRECRPALWQIRRRFVHRARAIDLYQSRYQLSAMLNLRSSIAISLSVWLTSRRVQMYFLSQLKHNMWRVNNVNDLCISFYHKNKIVL